VKIISIEKAICKIGTILNDKIMWIIGGSGSLLVHGIDVQPHDIDLIIDSADYDRACELMKRYLTSEKQDINSKNHTKFLIDKIEGEILVFNLNPDDLDKRNFHGNMIPVNKLEREYSFYKARTDKIDANKAKIVLIEAELNRRKTYCNT